MSGIYESIKKLAEDYSLDLKNSIDDRLAEMESDDNSHYLIYKVLGVTDYEGKLIDQYQNKGRFLYNCAGRFLEEAVILCFEQKYVDAKRKVYVPNTYGNKPKNFEIDCLVNSNAYEIKWRDATTDGDHITKEHTRVKSIKEFGYIPIRIMFYYPCRSQAIKIQETLKTLYNGIGGKYYYGNEAWNVVKDETGTNLYSLLERIANEKTNMIDKKV